MAKKSLTQTLVTCPCGQPQSYETCCGPYHQGHPAPTAEALMRSRYTAYVLRLEEYLLATWDACTRPECLDLVAESPRPQWLGLEIRQARSTSDSAATVEFVARYKVGGKASRLHEISRFRRENGFWFYVDGAFPTGPDAA